MILRKASLSDVELFFNLRNSRQARINSLNKKKINFKSHKVWYQNNYKKKNNFFFVITFKNQKAGYLRVQKISKFYDVSICIYKKFRNLNLASESLNKISKKIKKKITLRALIHYKNIVSINLFFKSGFVIKNLEKENYVMIKD